MPRAIVTGASSGLGRALSRLLARDGYELALVGRNEKALEALAQELRAANSKSVAVVKADLSKSDECEGLVEKCLNALGPKSPLTLLVNCAGYAVTGRTEDIPAEAIQKCWSVNFTAAVSLTQQAVLFFRRNNNEGLIVNVSSGVARRALPYYFPYCSAKAALNSFTESLRVELADTNIKVMLFSPGPVESGFHEAVVHYGENTLHQPPFHGRSAEAIAQLLLRAIHQRKERVVIGGKAALGYHLNYWAPRLADWLLGRMFKTSPTSSQPTAQRA
jgi:short-subunit dehydrogenase